MYLSRLTLDPRSREARRWLGDCHLLHTVTMRAFPRADDEAARAALGVLFRVEEDRRTGEVRVFVQSNVLPEWAIEAPGVRIDPPIALDALEATIANGRRYRFRLRANPTRRVHRRAALGPDPARGRLRAEHEDSVGKRVEIRDEAAQLAWLQRKGENAGFRLVRATLAKEEENVPATSADPGGRLRGEKRGLAREIVFGTALFEGELEVTEPAAFREVLSRGIGPGKAFGCGLLSVVPAG